MKMMNNQENRTLEHLREEMNVFFNEVYFLNLNTRILEKVMSFPWKTLKLEMKYNHFIGSLVRNYFEYSIIMVRRMIFDQGKRLITLKKLESRVWSILGKEKQSNIKDDQLRIKNLRKDVEKYEGAINSLRNEKYAHLSENLLSSSNENNITWDEFRSLVKAVNNYFDALGEIFRVEYLKIPSAYQSESMETDIDKILNKIALDSDILTSYEDCPSRWHVYEKQWKSKEERTNALKSINEYRLKLLNRKPIE